MCFLNLAVVCGVSRVSTSWISTLLNNESTFPKGLFGSGGSPPWVISLFATQRLTGGGSETCTGVPTNAIQTRQSTRAYHHMHGAKNEENRVGGNPRLKLHVPGPQEGIPRHAPPAPFNSRLAPAELSTRWQNLPSSTAFSYEPWPYGIWDR